MTRAVEDSRRVVDVVGRSTLNSHEGREQLWKLLHVSDEELGARDFDLSLHKAPEGKLQRSLSLLRFLGSGANFFCYSAVLAGEHDHVAVLIPRSSDVHVVTSMERQMAILRRCAEAKIEGVLRVAAVGPRVLGVTPLLAPLEFPSPFHGQIGLLIDTLRMRQLHDILTCTRARLTTITFTATAACTCSISP